MVMGSSSLSSTGTTISSEPLASRASKSGPSTTRWMVGGTRASVGSSSGDTKTFVAPQCSMM